MQILFVHGMGRSPLSGWPLLRRLEASGHTVATFGYSTALQAFEPIRDRLRRRLLELAAAGDYVLIGHSLGGVLLRSALRDLPPGVRGPRHLFLLGSPIRPARLARKLRHRLLYRILAGDCGQLLASARRMQGIGSVEARTTAIVGIRGLQGPFQGEPNDGIVAASELAASWIAEEIRVPVVHTFLPASRHVADILLDRLGACP